MAQPRVSRPKGNRQGKKNTEEGDGRSTRAQSTCIHTGPAKPHPRGRPRSQMSRSKKCRGVQKQRRRGPVAEESGDPENGIRWARELKKSIRSKKTWRKTRIPTWEGGKRPRHPRSPERRVSVTMIAKQMNKEERKGNNRKGDGGERLKRPEGNRFAMRSARGQSSSIRHIRSGSAKTQLNGTGVRNGEKAEEKRAHRRSGVTPITKRSSLMILMAQREDDEGANG